MKELIFLEPVLKECIWGGDRLSEFGYRLPSDSVGECWAISAHPNGDCLIKGGLYDGMHLSTLWDTHRELFGGLTAEHFPLLIKIIDAKRDLSIQVHPDDAYAALHENGASGKTECWYILDCDENATIVIGHRAGTKEEAERLVKEGKWSDFIREIPVHKGDFFQIEPGVVHAIKGGTVLLETQQNSDITYRVYDYDRLQNGVKRELHLEKSLSVIGIPFRECALERKVLPVKGAVCEELIRCRYYSVERWEISGETVLPGTSTFRNVSVVNGEGKLGGFPVAKGTNLLIPCTYGDCVAEGNMELICSTIEKV